jgi:hypothetical protein
MNKLIHYCVILLVVALLFMTTGVYGQTSSSPQIPKGVPNAGLIAYYSFDDGTARDNSGNGNEGQLQGGATIVPGKIGDAVSLDGASGSVNVPNVPAFNPSGQVTVSFWMKADPNNAMDKCCQGLVTTDYYGIEISGGRDPRIGVNFLQIPADLSIIPLTQWAEDRLYLPANGTT